MSLMNELVQFLGSKTSLIKNIAGKSKDGRVASALTEPEIATLVEYFCRQHKTRKLIFVQGETREWYDVAIRDETDRDDIKFYPINIKISSCAVADNANCKLGILWILTGKNPTLEGISNIIGREKFLRYLIENKVEEIANDYYFLILNKDKIDAGRYFWTSVRTLKESDIRINIRNFPFQCIWSGGKENRTNIEAEKFIISLLDQHSSKELAMAKNCSMLTGQLLRSK